MLALRQRFRDSQGRVSGACSQGRHRHAGHSTSPASRALLMNRLCDPLIPERRTTSASPRSCSQPANRARSRRARWPPSMVKCCGTDPRSGFRAIAPRCRRARLSVPIGIVSTGSLSSSDASPGPAPRTGSWSSDGASFDARVYDGRSVLASRQVLGTPAWAVLISGKQSFAQFEGRVQEMTEIAVWWSRCRQWLPAKLQSHEPSDRFGLVAADPPVPGVSLRL